MKLDIIVWNKILLLFLFANVGIINAQDLVVISSGDSLNCKITKLTNYNVKFICKHKGEIRRIELNRIHIKEAKYNFYLNTEVPFDIYGTKDNYSHFKMSIAGGYSYQIGKIGDDVPSETRDHVKRLQSGINLSGDLVYYVIEPIGFGLKYSIFRAKSEMAVFNYSYPEIKVVEKIYINFIGPYFSSRFYSSNSKRIFLLNYSIGYLNYLDKLEFGESIKVKGNSIGVLSEIGYDFCYSDNFAWGFQLSLLLGAMNKFTLIDNYGTKTIELEKNNFVSLSRIDISIGIRFNSLD